MKRILIFGIAILLSQSQVFAAGNFPQMEALGYEIGQKTPTSGLTDVNEEDPVNPNTSNDFYFKPLSNELNIDFDEYHLLTSTNGKKVASVFASKEYTNSQECQDAIKKSKPVLKNRYKIPVSESPELINFNPDTALTSVSLSCAENFLYYSVVDHRLTMK